MVGRNELCPCGSGRKYKKCCLEKDKAKDIARNRIKLGEKQFDNVITKISESTSEDYKAYKNKCEIDFGVSSYELENLMNVYYLVNYKYNKQSSLMMNYFNKHKQNINDADTEIIENTLNSYMSVYQVKEKDINKVLLRDILLNEDVYVEDIDLFSEFKAGDFLLARIIPVGNTKIFVDKVVKINESRKTQIKNDIDNRFKQTKKKCKTKKQCLINNIKFMYQNLIEARREYILDTSCDVVEENIEEVLHEAVVENKPKVVQIDSKKQKEKQKEKESKLSLIQNREKEIANKAYQKEKIDEKPVIEHGEKEIILEIEEPVTQTLKEEIEKEIALPMVQSIDEKVAKEMQQPIVEQAKKELIIEVEKPIKNENEEEIQIKKQLEEQQKLLAEKQKILEEKIKEIEEIKKKEQKIYEEEKTIVQENKSEKLEEKTVERSKPRKQVMARISKHPERFRNRKRINQRLEDKLKQRIRKTKKIEGMIAGLEFIRQRKLIKDRELDLKERELQLDEKLANESLEALKNEPEKTGEKQNERVVMNKDCNVEVKENIKVENNEQSSNIEDVQTYKVEQIESKIENISMSKMEQQIESKIENNLVAKMMVQELPKEQKIEIKDQFEIPENKSSQNIKSKKKDNQIKDKKQSECKDSQEQCKIYDVLISKVENEYKQQCIKAWKNFKKLHKSYTGSESGWAAAIEYDVKKGIDDSVTQEQIAKKYNVSARTLGKRYKELKIS